MKKQIGLIIGLVTVAGAVLADDMRELILPEQTPGLIDWFLASKAVSVAKYAAILTMAVQVIKALVVGLGAKIPAKYTPAVLALVAFVGAWEQATADGRINGQDWSTLIVAILGTIGAFFGYKVLFSTRARVQRGD